MCTAKHRRVERLKVMGLVCACCVYKMLNRIMYIQMQPNARSLEAYIVHVNKTCDVATPHFLSSLLFHIIKISLVFLLITLGLQQHAQNSNTNSISACLAND